MIVTFDTSVHDPAQLPTSTVTGLPPMPRAIQLGIRKEPQVEELYTGSEFLELALHSAAVLLLRERESTVASIFYSSDKHTQWERAAKAVTRKTTIFISAAE